MRVCLQGMMNVPEEEDVRAAFLRHDGIEDAEVCALCSSAVGCRLAGLLPRALNAAAGTREGHTLSMWVVQAVQCRVCRWHV